MVRLSGGKRYRVWELPPGRANEVLDTRVYAYAALCGLTYRGMRSNRRADDTGAVNTRKEVNLDTNEEVAVVRQPPAPEPPSKPKLEPIVIRGASLNRPRSVRPPAGWLIV